MFGLGFLCSLLLEHVVLKSKDSCVVAELDCCSCAFHCSVDFMLSWVMVRGFVLVWLNMMLITHTGISVAEIVYGICE